MAELRLGPLLRYVDGTSATVWVEASEPCTATVRAAADGSALGSARTFHVAGHDYALVAVEGLAPGTVTPYEVVLDDAAVWPPRHDTLPPPEIRTPAPGAEVRVAFGSCRWAAPPTGGSDPVGPDALDALAARLTAVGGDAAPPDLLVLLGDQVYADETSPDTRAWLAKRRDLSKAPGDQVADFEEYTRLYHESWLDPEVRRLLATTPVCMVFDDHDVIDDWNTSARWQAEIRAEPWWRERILSGLMSYWVYQHIGNLSPAELAADPVYKTVSTARDGTEALRAFVSDADADPTAARWSYRRDVGRTRLVMVDSRAARVLDEQERAMVHPGEAAWVREQIMDSPGSYDHLLIGTSLPWLLPPLIHQAEVWDAALCRGVRGARWARFGEWLRRYADLEHWGAFTASFDWLTELIDEAGSAGGGAAPATICVLSGDVHHAYVAEPSWRREGAAPAARVLQLTCSPVHNSIPSSMKWGFRFGWSRPARALGGLLRRHAKAARPAIDWDALGDGPWFGNQLMTLSLRGRAASLVLEQARAASGELPGGAGRLVTADERALTTAEGTHI
ncbi:alkaline phosphatase D family protein [Streptomyces sp. NPDC050560]|uniref:alkaline phosphatase D family protein n=1 Tax=Streptomyces sp. NPDC050560 TaxID=3365630 RepID=UPI0037A807B5